MSDAQNDSPLAPPVEVTTDEKQLAMLAHLCSVFGSIIGPAIIYLIKKDESEYIAYHALQALIFQVLSLVVVFLVIVPIIVISFGLCSPIGFVVPLTGVYFGIKANEGNWNGYPLIGDIGKPSGR